MVDIFKSLKPDQLSPRTILLGTFAIFLGPFLLVELFPLQLNKVMDVGAYVALHNTSEFFSIMVSLCVFSVGWYTYEQSKDRHALFLGVAFLAVGLVDFMHTMANAAMPAFLTPNSTNKSTQFWLTARMLSALSFLVSAYIYPATQSRWLSKSALMTAALVISGLAFIGITFFPVYLPATALPGVGITPLKRFAEFLVIALFFLAGLAYWQRMAKTGNRRHLYYLAAFIICIFSEGMFASYTTGFDTFNVMGHIYKVIAFYLIYKGVFAASVQAPYINLLKTREQLYKDIARRKQVEEDLERHRNGLEGLVKERTAQLERANRQLESFSSSVAHDLRAPLRTIGTFAHMLGVQIKDKLEPEEKRKLEVIRDKAKKLHQLTEDLLSFSRLGNQVLTIAPIDMKVLAAEVRDELREMHPERNIMMEIASLPAGYGDPGLVRQVLANLLANAVKFTKGKPEAVIEVGGREDTDAHLYYVKDNGIGFDMMHHEKLFGIFQRLHGDEKYEGSGVGLSIVKHIVGRHGGRVWAEGKVNEGAVFYFTLPKNVM